MEAASVAIKDEDLEMRTPLRSNLSSDFASSDHGEKEDKNQSGR